MNCIRRKKKQHLKTEIRSTHFLRVDVTFTEICSPIDHSFGMVFPCQRTGKKIIIILFSTAVFCVIVSWNQLGKWTKYSLAATMCLTVVFVIYNEDLFCKRWWNLTYLNVSFREQKETLVSRVIYFFLSPSDLNVQNILKPLFIIYVHIYVYITYSWA